MHTYEGHKTKANLIIVNVILYIIQEEMVIIKHNNKNLWRQFKVILREQAENQLLRKLCTHKW
jgi:hypothetical protein